MNPVGTAVSKQIDGQNLGKISSSRVWRMRGSDYLSLAHCLIIRLYRCDDVPRIQSKTVPQSHVCIIIEVQRRVIVTTLDDFTTRFGYRGSTPHT